MANKEYCSGSVDLNRPYLLGACEVNPATGRIRNVGGVVKLQPQAIEVLTYLASRPGEVVCRAEIEEAVWQGRTVGYDSLTGIIFKLRKALCDDPRQPHIIETLSKRGYRLLAHPKPAGTLVGDRSTLASAELPIRWPATRWAVGLSSIVLLFIAVVSVLPWLGGLSVGRDDGTPTTERSAIVVLPFETLGAADDQDVLADGLTDDLTTALAKNHDLSVIARDSAFVYKDEAVDFREIAERLKADYILRGTVRSAGERLRVNVQLVDTSDGSHVWAEQYDDDAGAFFDLEDRIVTTVIQTLTDRSSASDSDRTLIVRTSNPRAYELFQLGRQHFYLYLNKRENAEARDLFGQALALDPHFAMARAMLAWTYAFEAMNGWASDREGALQKADAEARRVIAENPGIPLSYFITGLVFRERKEYVKAIVEAEKAIELDPSYANAHVLVATLLYYAGRPAESIERLKTAMRLNPHHPFNYYFHLGQAYFTLHQYDDAIEVLLAGTVSNPAAERLHVWLAASYAQAGMMEDANWEAEQVRLLNPEFSLAKISSSFPFKDERDHDRFLDGLRKAGLS